MGFMDDFRANQAKTKAEMEAKREKALQATGKKLGEVLLEYGGGYGSEYKKTFIGGTLICYEKEVFYKKRKNSFTIPSDQIVGFEVGGQQQTNSRISVTRMATLGVFSLAAPKRSTVKDTSVTIALKDGRQVFFRTTQYTPSDVHSKLANAISYYNSLQVKSATQQKATAQAVASDPAKEIMKYAVLRKRGIITEEEFQAKKKQLLGL